MATLLPELPEAGKEQNPKKYRAKESQRRTMISDLILATERLKTEKKYLSKMVTKLVEENQKLLGENRHFQEKITSFQSSPVPRKRVVGEIDEVKSTFTKVKKLQDLEQQKVEEISEFHECKVHKHREFLSTERINHLKMDLQQCEREMEEKKEDIIKEKHQISETRGTVAEQGKIIEDLQIQINHLQEELKNSELIASQPMERKEVHSESPTHEVAKANLLEKLVNSCLSKRLSLLRKPLALDFKLLLCLIILLALCIFYTYCFHTTWICQLLQCARRRHYSSGLRPH